MFDSYIRAKQVFGSAIDSSKIRDYVQNAKGANFGIGEEQFFWQNIVRMTERERVAPRQRNRSDLANSGRRPRDEADGQVARRHGARKRLYAAGRRRCDSSWPSRQRHTASQPA
jgi:hypothetical protein